MLLAGGTEIHTLNLATALTAAGYKTTVCCYYEYDQDMVRRFEKTGSEVFLMKQKRAEGLWQLTTKLISQFRTRKPDFVHVQYIAPGLVPVVAARIAGIRTVFATVHQPGRVYGLKEKLLLQTAAMLCNIFFCVSKSVEESWFGRSEVFNPTLPQHRRNHFTLYNAVDVDAISSAVSSAESRGLKEAIGLSGKKVIGFAGRLRREKGLDILLNAMPQVLKSYPDAVLVVVGDGPDREVLTKKAEALKITSQVIWAGQKTREEVFQFYRIMDVMAVPSLFEGFGLAAAEAMAAGVPVVGAKVDGLTEIVEDTRSGLLFPAGNSHALSAALIKLLGDTEESKRIGLNAQIRVRELFSPDRFSRQYLSAYERFFANRSV